MHKLLILLVVYYLNENKYDLNILGKIKKRF